MCLIPLTSLTPPLHLPHTSLPAALTVEDEEAAEEQEEEEEAPPPAKEDKSSKKKKEKEKKKKLADADSLFAMLGGAEGAHARVCLAAVLDATGQCQGVLVMGRGVGVWRNTRCWQARTGWMPPAEQHGVRGGPASQPGRQEEVHRRSASIGLVWWPKNG